MERLYEWVLYFWLDSKQRPINKSSIIFFSYFMDEKILEIFWIIGVRDELGILDGGMLWIFWVGTVSIE